MEILGIWIEKKFRANSCVSWASFFTSEIDLGILRLILVAD
jgi:hypothetical protein